MTNNENQLNRLSSSTPHTPEAANTTDAGSEIIAGYKAKARQIGLAIMSTLATLVPGASTTSTIGTVAGGATAGMLLTSCGEEGGEVKPEDPNALNEEQQAFKDVLDPTNPKVIAAGIVVTSILDGKPVVSIPVSPVPNNLNFTEAFQGFMDIELRMIDAKTQRYSITPIINRSSVEKIIELAAKLEPGKAGYGISLVNQALNSVGNKRSLSPGVEISKDDDNNPATIEPHLSILPEKFTMKEFNKYYTSSQFIDSFVLIKDEKFNMIMDIATVGLKFDTVVYPVAPIAEAQSIVRN